MGSRKERGHSHYPQCSHHRRQYLPGCALLVLPLSPRHRRTADVRQKGRGRVLRGEGTQSVPFDFRRHEDGTYPLFRGMSRGDGYSGLHAENPRGRLGRRGGDYHAGEPHAHADLPGMPPCVPGKMQPVRGRGRSERTFCGACLGRLYSGAQGQIL